MPSRLATRFAVLALGTTPVLHAAEFSYYVGTDSRTCDFATIGQAIAAASTAAGDFTTIRISGNATYNENLDLGGKNLRLIGAEPCGRFVGSWNRPILSGAGGARRSIVNINGAARDFTLRNLVLRDGDQLLDPNSYGGALDITGGPHQVEIENVAFTQNVAGYGGAISVRGTRTPGGIVPTSTVHIKDQVTVSGNRSAYGGGGVYCSQANLFIQGLNSFVNGNIAGGAVDPGETPPAAGGVHGGGLRLTECEARIAIPSIAANEASGDGGGIAALFNSTRLEIGNLTPTNPTRIAGNISGGYGGGIYLLRGAEAVLNDSIVEDNTARGGGGGIAMVNLDEGQPLTFTSLTMTSSFNETSGRARCRSDIECNVIRNNEAYDGATPKIGAALLISQTTANPEIFLHGVRITGNRGIDLIEHVGGAFENGVGLPFLFLNGVLIDRNELSHSLFDNNPEVGGGCIRYNIQATTIVDNQITGASLFRSPLCLTKFYRSIVHQPGKSLLPAGGSVPLGRVKFVLANQGAFAGVPDEFEGGQRVNQEGIPLFVDAASDNYFLQRGWLGLDFAPAENTNFTRDSGNRVVDLTATLNRFGPQDLGAFETPNGPPELNAPVLPDGRVGVPYDYFVGANGQGGRLSYSSTGLPAGLSIDRDSAAISGTPAQFSEGSYNVQIDVSNGMGETTTVVSPLTILGNGVVFADGFE